MKRVYITTALTCIVVLAAFVGIFRLLNLNSGKDHLIIGFVYDKSFIAEIHVTEEPEVIQGNNYWVKRIRFKVPIRVSETEEGDTFNVDHSFQPNDEHVE